MVGVEVVVGFGFGVEVEVGVGVMVGVEVVVGVVVGVRVEVVEVGVRVRVEVVVEVEVVMTTLASDTIKDPSWYTKEGEPRKGTVREARKEGWLPGTTSVLKMYPSPGLNIYFREQDILAAGTTPRLSVETDKEWTAKVIKSAAEHAANSRGFGSNWAECQSQGVCIHEYLRPWFELAQPESEIIVAREQVVVNTRYGYAGRLDRLSRFGQHETIWLTDDKCREKPRVYDTDVMQLAAYLDCLPLEQWVRTKCRSRVINRLTPEPPMIREWSIEEVREGFERFLACLKMFKLFHHL